MVEVKAHFALSCVEPPFALGLLVVLPLLAFFCRCAFSFFTAFSRIWSLQSSVLCTALLPRSPAFVHFEHLGLGFFGSPSRLRFFGVAVDCGLWSCSKYFRACASV